MRGNPRFFKSLLGSSFFFAPPSLYPLSSFSGGVAAIVIVTLPGVRPAPTLSPPGLPPATRATACICFFVRSSRRWAGLAARCVFCLCVVALASLAVRFRISVGDCSTRYISCRGLMLNSHELVNTRPRRTHADCTPHWVRRKRYKNIYHVQSLPLAARTKKQRICTQRRAPSTTVESSPPNVFKIKTLFCDLIIAIL